MNRKSIKGYNEIYIKQNIKGKSSARGGTSGGVVAGSQSSGDCTAKITATTKTNMIDKLKIIP
ncbi:MAG: hypothetical protein ACFFG0_48155 [Candidatus Thorarchaeota archaeon]